MMKVESDIKVTVRVMPNSVINNYIIYVLILIILILPSITPGVMKYFVILLKFRVYCCKSLESKVNFVLLIVAQLLMTGEIS